jgi:hypothetical protein
MVEILPEITPYIVAFAFFSIYSILYKYNLLYGTVEAWVLGLGMAHVALGAWRSISTTIVVKAQAGDLLNTGIPLIIGLLYFTVFFPQVKTFYTYVVMLSSAATMGVRMPMGVGLGWGAATGMAGKATSSGWEFLSFLVFIVTIIYFLFSRKLEGPTRIPSAIGRLCLWVYCCTGLTTTAMARVNMMEGYLLEIFGGIGWWVPLIIGVGILIDLVVGWRNILGLAPRVEPAA